MEAETLARSFQCEYIETSAKTGLNVISMFQSVVLSQV